MKTKFGMAFTVVLFLLRGTSLLACFCVHITGFDEVSAIAPVVVIGRVLSVGGSGSDIGDPSVIRVRVESVPKGEFESKEFSVWNPKARGSCGGALRGFEIGSLVSIALSPYREATDYIQERARGLMARMGRDVTEDDWLLFVSGCGISIKLISGKE